MASDLIDWKLAEATARRLAPPGPPMPMEQARAVVAELRALADEAERHVEDYTGLRPAPGMATSVAVVDRGEWSRSNVASMRLMVGPLMARLAEKRTGALGSAALGTVGRTLTGAELGGGLAYLSTKVLGQYEVFVPPEDGDGRLCLVAPNIVEVERRLGVLPRDFRMWVCLHEQTHRTQFTAVPWMRAHLASLLDDLLSRADIDPSALVARARQLARELARGGGRAKVKPLDLVYTPEQRVLVERIQAVMTLLEGHAEQVMDAVGPRVVPSVETIRTRFDAQRGGGSPLDRVLRRLLGLDAKLEQYRTGGRFVRAVVAEIGVEGFNQVWAAPERLPSSAELAEPERWLARVHRGEVTAAP